MSDSLFDLNFTILRIFFIENEESRTRFGLKNSDGEIHKRKAIILLWEKKALKNLKTRARARPIKLRALARKAKSSEYPKSVF
jgi:hypothetical protein